MSLSVSGSWIKAINRKRWNFCLIYIAPNKMDLIGILTSLSKRLNSAAFLHWKLRICFHLPYTRNSLEKFLYFLVMALISLIVYIISLFVYFHFLAYRCWDVKQNYTISVFIFPFSVIWITNYLLYYFV